MPPGREVHRIYEEFARVHRLNTNITQHTQYEAYQAQTNSKNAPPQQHQQQPPPPPLQQPQQLHMPTNNMSAFHQQPSNMVPQNSVSNRTPHEQQQKQISSRQPGLVVREHRMNGAIDQSIDNRYMRQPIPQHPQNNVPRQVPELERLLEQMDASVSEPRRPSPLPSVVEPRAVTSVFGTSLPTMASPPSVAAAVFAAAGSY